MRALAREIFGRALARMDPERLVIEAADSIPEGRVRLLALGKAALPMAKGAARLLGDRLSDGLVVSNVGGAAPERCDLMIGSHPVPSADSERAGRALLERAARGGVDAICALVSGGASALAAVPAPGLRLQDEVEALRLLSAAGAPIAELNCARKHLSAIKGGRLAAAASAPVTALILSDVVGDDLSVVGSGPTVRDATRRSDAVAVFERYLGRRGKDEQSPRSRVTDVNLGLTRILPKAVLKHLSAESDTVEVNSVNILLAGIADFVEAARAEASAILGAPVESMGGAISGDVAEVAAMLAARARSTRIAVVGGGEATIALPDEPGVGGRAQQLALLVAKRIAGVPEVAVLIAGSDGIDGNSDAAGAVVNGDTWGELASAGVDGDDALLRCDAGTALARIGATLVTGPTGVNHADLMLILGRAR